MGSSNLPPCEIIFFPVSAILWTMIETIRPGSVDALGPVIQVPLTSPTPSSNAKLPSLSTLRVPPAMEAGLIKRLMSIEEIVRLAELK